ncbi:hypothetical protein [Kingella kingae]|uniref:hypothetical protein n=1 Tax=Kingella kingae TaxID=504 RepID=UPI000A6B1B35|nr:hypothetical protein [Kingella kingae]
MTRNLKLQIYQLRVQVLLTTQVQAAFVESHPNPQIFTAKSNTQINQKSSLQLLSHKKTS